MTTQQQSELLEIMIDNSFIFDDDDDDDENIVTSIMFCCHRKNFFKILRQIITIFNGINPCTNDLIKAIIQNGELRINGSFFSVTRSTDKHYAELKALIKEKRYNGN